MYTNRVFGTAKCVLFIVVSFFQGVSISGLCTVLALNEREGRMEQHGMPQLTCEAAVILHVHIHVHVHDRKRHTCTCA